MISKNVSEKELNDIGILHRQNIISYVDKTGNSCEEYNSVAKISQFVDEVDSSKINTYYYIKYRRGQLFDPYGIDALKSNAKDTRYKKVDEYIYNKYVDYLKTRREVYLHEAKRDFIRKGY